MAAQTRELIHQAVDRLSDESLGELSHYIDFLQFKERQGSAYLKTMVESFSHVQDAVDASGMNDDEINQLIDDSIHEARQT